MMGKTRHIAAIAGAAASVLLLTGGTTMAQAEGLDEVREFHIEAQSLDAALIEFSEQADLQLMVQTELVAGRQSPGVNGALSSSDALVALLNDSELSFTAVGDDTVAVSKPDEGGDSDSGNGRPAGARQSPVMMAQASAEQSQASRRTETDSDEDERRRPLEEIIVTGTHIRGIAPESSPVRIFDREDIQMSGAATAQDFIQTLPQNFGGGSNADIPVSLPNDDNASFNTGTGSLGSSVNLRGLGSGSTLVLLNGRRLAPSSGIGDFVDISMIPTSAIERIEVLTDGASSIYGADAVAGVVNFVLRDDFEGFETNLRYGTVTQGDVDEYRTSLTAGGQWDSGHALATYEFFDVGALSAADRTFSNTAPLPNDLLPNQKRHSGFGTVSQEVTSEIEVFADLLYSNRKGGRDFTNPALESFRSAPRSENLNISSGGSWKVSETWFLDISGTYSKLHIKANSTGADTSGMRRIDSDVWTADSKASGAILTLPGGDLKLAIGGHYRTEDFTNFDVLDDEVARHAERNVKALFSEAFIPIVGPSNEISGIERLELNVSGRYEDYSDFGSTANPKVGVLWSPFDALNLRGSYSTSFKPPPLGRVGANDISVLIARTSLINAVLGLTAGDPSIADVVELSVAGTAKDLDAEKSRAFTAGFDFSEQWGPHDLNLTATWFDIDFDNRLGIVPVPDSRLALDAPNIAFDNPELFPEGAIIVFPTLEQIGAVLNSVDFPLVNVDGSNPLDASIVNNVQLARNLARTEVSGFDFDVNYSLAADSDVFSVGIGGTYLQDFKRQAAVTTPLVEQISTLYNPVDLRLRGRAGYSRNGFVGNIFVNYSESYRVDNTADAAPIDSWMTFDVTLSYDTREKYNNSILDNTVLRFSVLNLFDKDPPSTPSIPSLGIFGFDPTNASPLGRFIAFEVTKGF